MTDENNFDLNLVTLLTNKVIPVSEMHPIEVTDVRTFPSWQHDTLNYVTRWANGETLPLTLRTFRSPLTYWQTQDPNKRDRVWAVLRRLRLDNYPSPRPLARGALGNTDFIIWATVQGGEWIGDANDMVAALRPLVPQLAELLARLHALDHNGLNDEPLYQATVAGTLVRMLLWSREMDEPELKEMIARLKPTVANIRSWQHKLIHGDPHPGNVLTRDGQITAVLNWEHAAIGDPRWDVMTAAHWIRDINPGFAEQFINWYETFTGKHISDRAFWYALVSVRQWALKAWLNHAIESKKASSALAGWTEDVSAAKARAHNDLLVAGL